MPYHLRIGYHDIIRRPKQGNQVYLLYLRQPLGWFSQGQFIAHDQLTGILQTVAITVQYFEHMFLRGFQFYTRFQCQLVNILPLPTAHDFGNRYEAAILCYLEFAVTDIYDITLLLCKKRIEITEVNEFCSSEIIPENQFCMAGHAVESNQAEVLIMDMDVIFPVGFPEFLIQHVVVNEVLRALRPKLQHDAHAGICIDIRIVPLQVYIHGIREKDITVALHQVPLGLAALRMLLAVFDVFLRNLIEAVLHQFLLDNILYVLDADALPLRNDGLNPARHSINVRFGHLLPGIAVGTLDGVADLDSVIGNCHAGTLDHCLQFHALRAIYKIYGPLPAFHYILWFLIFMAEYIVAKNASAGNRKKYRLPRQHLCSPFSGHALRLFPKP